MSEAEGSRKVRKTGSPKERKKSEVSSPKSEVGMPNPEVRPEVESQNSKVKSQKHEKEKHSAIDTPQSALKQPPTAKPQPQTMEVHHHPDLHHKPKPWKDYLLEYLMIFLAVMTGFFAESYREHLGDKNKEQEYMSSLIRDLRNDVSEAKFVKQDKLMGISLIDSTLLSFENGEFKSKTSDLYYWVRSLGIRNYFKLNDGTIQQLNNAGGLRLIHKRGVLDSLQHYINNAKDLLALQQVEELQLVSYKESCGEVFDAQAMNKMYIKSDTGVAKLKLQKLDRNTPLISYDKKEINKVTMKLVGLKGIRLSEVNNMNRIMRKADMLIQQVKKEYMLGDE